MKKGEGEKLRNIGLFSHGGDGKTSLAEAILFDTGINNRLGKVDEGSSIMDYEPEEINRHITISTSIAQINWEKIRINIVDTPGDANFIPDAFAAMRVVDGAIILVSAVSGVKVQTEKVWNYTEKFQIPRIIFVNKMDRERANFFNTIDDIKESLSSSNPVALQIPIGAEESFEGIIDLIKMKALRYKKDESGQFNEEDIPADLMDESTSFREKMIETLVESDDTIMEKYLDGEELKEEELFSCLKKGLMNKLFTPVILGSALKNIGIQPLLNLIKVAMPSPVERGNVKGKDPKDNNEIEREPSEDAPFSAYVFKTIADPFTGRLNIFRIYSGTLLPDSTILNSTKNSKERIGQILKLEGKKQKPVDKGTVGDILALAKLKDTSTGDTLCDEKEPIIFEKTDLPHPVISFALSPKTKGDEDKVASSLNKLLEEDPTLNVGRDEQTKEILLSGMGQVHIEATLEKLKRKFGVEVELKAPRVPYKETIKGTVKVQGKYKRQSGGRGQYGDTWIELKPLERGKGFEFIDKIVGGVIPKNYIPAVEKGIVEAMQSGVVAGYPVTDISVTLYDGSFHPVDSSDMAFKIAASMGFKKGMQMANPVLLEPIMKMEITVPEENMGDIIGDLNSRRGKVIGVEAKGRYQIIRAYVPMAEVLKYAPDLNSMTGGRGDFTMEFSHYEEVPPNIAEKVISEAKSEGE